MAGSFLNGSKVGWRGPEQRHAPPPTRVTNPLKGGRGTPLLGIKDTPVPRVRTTVLCSGLTFAPSLSAALLRSGVGEVGVMGNRFNIIRVVQEIEPNQSGALPASPSCMARRATECSVLHYSPHGRVA